MLLWSIRRTLRALALLGAAQLALLLLLALATGAPPWQLSLRRVVRDVPYLLRPLWDRATRFSVIARRGGGGLAGANASCAAYGWRDRGAAAPGARRPLLYDCFTFQSELELLEVRLAELAPAVDFFVLVEATRTFTGRRKPLYYRDRWRRHPRLAPYADRIVALAMGEAEQARIRGYGAMAREKAQRRFILRGLVREGVVLAPGDVVLISDVDEIPRRGVAALLKRCAGYPAVLHLQLRRFAYSFAWPDGGAHDTHSAARTYVAGDSRLSSRLFVHGHTEATPGGGIRLLADAGWHCSFCFRYLEDFQSKMAAYAHAERAGAADSVYRSAGHIQEAICAGRDLFDMLPEAYTFGELWARMRRRRPLPQLRDAPALVLAQPAHLDFLQPGHCRRPLARPP